MVAVPLYDTLGPEALVFIINQGNWSFFHQDADNDNRAGTASLWEWPLITLHLFVAPAPFICSSFSLLSAPFWTDYQIRQSKADCRVS